MIRENPMHFLRMRQPWCFRRVSIVLQNTQGWLICRLARMQHRVFGCCLSHCCYLHSWFSLDRDPKPDSFSNEKKLMVKLVFPQCKFVKANISKPCFPGPFWPALWPYTNLFFALLSLSWVPCLVCASSASLLQQSAFALAAVNTDSLYSNLVPCGSGWWFRYMDFFFFFKYINC